MHSLVTQTNQAKSRRVATENEELKDKEEAILSLSLKIHAFNFLLELNSVQKQTTKRISFDKHIYLLKMYFSPIYLKAF